MDAYLRYFSEFVVLSLLFICSLDLFCLPPSSPFLILNNPINAGFGATSTIVLGALDFYEEGHYEGIKVDLNSGIYLDEKKGANWWEYFFEPLCLGKEDKDTVYHVFSEKEVLALADRGFMLSRKRGFELIQKYFHLKPSIQKKVSRFMKKNFKNYFIIGVHHRGTDKHLEAPLVSYSTIVYSINWWLAAVDQKTQVRIFLATDDQNFLNYLYPLFPHQLIYNCFVRSSNDSPVHYNDSLYTSNYQKGEEALLDCLLLSKCNLLIFPSTSSLSLLSTKFNPDQLIVPLSN